MIRSETWKELQTGMMLKFPFLLRAGIVRCHLAAISREVRLRLGTGEPVNTKMCLFLDLKYTYHSIPCQSEVVFLPWHHLPVPSHKSMRRFMNLPDYVCHKTVFHHGDFDRVLSPEDPLVEHLCQERTTCFRSYVKTWVEGWVRAGSMEKLVIEYNPVKNCKFSKGVQGNI